MILMKLCRNWRSDSTSNHRRWLDILGIEEKKEDQTQREVLSAEWRFFITTKDFYSRSRDFQDLYFRRIRKGDK